MPSGLEFKVIESPKDGRPYLVLRYQHNFKPRKDDKWSYHYFVEVEAKEIVSELTGVPKADVDNREFIAAWNQTKVESVKRRAKRS